MNEQELLEKVREIAPDQVATVARYVRHQILMGEDPRDVFAHVLSSLMPPIEVESEA